MAGAVGRIADTLDRRTVWALGFGAAGFLINLLPVHLLPGAHVFFGGVLSLVPGFAFGPVWGIIGEGLAALPSIYFLGHPYFAVLMIVQGGFLSYFVSRSRYQATAAALLFWSAAAPILFLTTRLTGTKLPPYGGLLPIGTAALNSLISALTAELILYSRPIQRRLFGRLMPSRPLHLYIMHLFAPLVAVPLIAVMAVSGWLQLQSLIRERVLEGRTIVLGLEKDLESSLEHYSGYLRLLADDLSRGFDPVAVRQRLDRYGSYGIDFSDVLFYPASGTGPVVFRGEAGMSPGQGREVRAAWTADFGRPQMATSPATGTAAVRFTLEVRDQVHDQAIGHLVGYVPLDSVMAQAVRELPEGVRVVWAYAQGDGPEQVAFSTRTDLEVGAPPGDVYEGMAPVRGVDGAYVSPHDWLEHRLGRQQPTRLLTSVSGSVLGGTYYLLHDMVPDIASLYGRQAGFVLMGLIVLIMPIGVAPILSHRVAGPVERLANLPMDALIADRLQDFLPKAGEGIEEIRKLSHHLQTTALQNRRLFASVRESREALLRVLISVLERGQGGYGRHHRRVVHYALRLADELKVNHGVRQALRWGGLLHDIGMVAIPEGIWKKNGSLSESECKQVQKHCEVGAEIVEDIEAFAPAMDVIRYHHERWDGSGYPYGLAGDAIPFAARIFAVVDALDAMTTERSYRRHVRSFAEALEELRSEAGKQFDPEVVEAAARVGPQGWEALRDQAHESDLTALIVNMVADGA